MAFRKNIKIMLSSRCTTKIKNSNGTISTLSALRTELKTMLEKGALFNKKLFDVWISEDPQSPDALDSSWEECMERVKECNFLICLYSGEAGWAKGGGDIGICHAELETAFSYEPGKVFIINIEDSLDGTPQTTSDEGKRNKRFSAYVHQINRFYEPASTYEDIIDKCKSVLAEAIVRFVDLGKREANRGKFNSGIALDWSRMNYGERKEIIEKTMIDQLKNNNGKLEKNNIISLNIQSEDIAFVCHGIPAGMGIAAARELVGQPFLKDHIITEQIEKKLQGPVHLIGIHKGVTENQAVNQLGFPDAIIVDAPFGIYVADKVQKIQMIFLANCRDDSSTRHNVQRFMDWIEETGESNFIKSRSISRKKIVNLILKEKE